LFPIHPRSKRPSPSHECCLRTSCGKSLSSQPCYSAATRTPSSSLSSFTSITALNNPPGTLLSLSFRVCQHLLPALSPMCLPSLGHCFGSLPPPLRTARVLLRLVSRPAGFGSLQNNLLHRTQNILLALPKMHPLALGGGPLASLRVVCPERLQSQGTKRRFQRWQPRP
jgi:hypothetical protein